MIGSDVAAEVMLTLLNFLDLTSCPLLTRLDSRFVEGRQNPPLYKDFSYLAKLFCPILKEELATLARYTRRISTYLALGASNH